MPNRGKRSTTTMVISIVAALVFLGFAILLTGSTTTSRATANARTLHWDNDALTAAIDPLSGGLATGLCPQILTESFLAGTEPDRLCYLHGDGYWRPQREWEDRFERRQRRWKWLRKIFGKRRGPQQ